MIYLTNGFSIHMLERLNVGDFHEIRIQRINSKKAGDLLRGNNFRSYFGHADTARQLEKYLRCHVPMNRDLVNFERRDLQIIATVESKRKWEQGEKAGPGFKFYLIEYGRR